MPTNSNWSKSEKWHDQLSWAHAEPLFGTTLSHPYGFHWPPCQACHHCSWPWNESKLSMLVSNQLSSPCYSVEHQHILIHVLALQCGTLPARGCPAAIAAATYNHSHIWLKFYAVLFQSNILWPVTVVLIFSVSTKWTSFWKHHINVDDLWLGLNELTHSWHWPIGKVTTVKSLKTLI